MSQTIKSKLVAAAKQQCRDLRAKATPSEQVLWDKLRNRRLKGRKFYRQYPIFVDYAGKETFFIADFYCHEEALVLEIDGPIHRFQENNDALRTRVIHGMGLQVIRFRNEEVLQDVEGVLKKIENSLSTTTHPSPSLGKRGADNKNLAPHDTLD